MLIKFKEKPRFNDGDIRIITKFCWLPEPTPDGYYWLQFVSLEQEAKRMYYEAWEWTQWRTLRVLEDRPCKFCTMIIHRGNDKEEEE